MDVVLASTRMMTSTRIPSCNILFPAPLKFGIAGNPVPPRSNFVGFGIFSSVSRLGTTLERPHHLHCVIRRTVVPYFPTHFGHFFIYLRLLLHPSRVTSPPTASRFAGTGMGLSIPTQPYHNIL